MNQYESFAIALDALRNGCSRLGIAEFMPPPAVPGYAHHPHMHVTVNIAEDSVILPYQLSLHNRVAAHYLNRPTFCVGPCFRNDEHSDFHRRHFTQFAFEFFSQSLDDLIDVSILLLSKVLVAQGVSLPIRTIDLLADNTLSDAGIRRYASDNDCAVLVKNKRCGVPPLLNAREGNDYERAIEIVLPKVGETLDGGVRDPNVLIQVYGVTPARSTVGASFGLDRLVAFFLKAQDLSRTKLL